MRIGIVCYPTFGGSGVVATELGKALAEKGHIIHFISYDRPARLNVFSDNILFHQVNPETYPLFDFLPYESALVSKLVDVVRCNALDLLHVHYAVPHASSAFFAQQILRSFGVEIPFITTLHGTDITLVGREASYEPVVTFSINRSDGVTAVSEYLKQATLQNFDIQNEINVIPNFIDLSRYSPQQQNGIRRNMTPGDEKVLLHVSNFRPVKRVHDALEIFRRVRQELPVKMIFAGDGPERQAVERDVQQYGLSKDVIFLGKQEAVENILPMGDLFLIPSSTESFGLAALEAMACGLPVIGTNAGGLPEVIEHGKSGYLSEIGDVETMARNAVHMLEQQDRYDAYRQAALRRAQVFSLQNIVPLYESYYEAVLAGEVAGKVEL